MSSLLAGASRVLMAARLANAPHHARVQALVVQAVQLAAQISRTIAAQRDATAALQRAAAATERAAVLVAMGPMPAGWQFTKPGAEVINAARRGAIAAGGPGTDARPTDVERELGSEKGR